MTMPSAETIMLFAIPMFFVLIGVELLAARLMRRRVFAQSNRVMGEHVQHGQPHQAA